MAYQTYIVHVLAVAAIFLALIAGNIGPLGITNPWLVIVVIPGLVGAVVYASNQLKSIGKPAANTTTETKTVTTQPPQP